MITRLKVDGFKNLAGVDLRLGPFTCIAGANGVGKSNLFDALKFLCTLADKPMVEAACSVRDEQGKSGSPRSLLLQAGDWRGERMRFEVEMIVPSNATDDFGQPAVATSQLLRYVLEIEVKGATNGTVGDRMEICREELTGMPKQEIKRIARNLRAKHCLEAVKAQKKPFISTKGSEVWVHQDKTSGRAVRLSRPSLTRTALSSADAQFPTALCARRELASWHMLQLEPEALRKPSAFLAAPHLTSNGENMPATLYNLAASQPNLDVAYGQVTSQLRDLIDDAYRVRVERDETRQLLTLYVKGRDGSEHAARSLSDGTLRFLALAVLELDVSTQGIVCLEEPENGIHPSRIPAMLKLLRNIAVDTEEPLDSANPLRQVIVNTHSPVVVQEVNDDDLVVAETVEDCHAGHLFRRAEFRCLSDTWRCSLGDSDPVDRGSLLAYLNPIAHRRVRTKRPRRVVEREDLQPYLPKFSE